MTDLHPLLVRQLKKTGINTAEQSAADTLTLSFSDFEKLLQKISRTYKDADQDRYTIERTLEISSEEMRDVYSQLQEERNLLQALMSDGYIHVDKDWRIKFINKSAEEFLSITPKEYDGQEFANCIQVSRAEASNKVDITKLQSAVRDGGIFRCERGYIYADHHQPKPVSFAVNPIVKNDTFLGAIILFHDISEQVERELALESAKRYAEESNKAKSLFLANMSHEIRTPLNGVYGMIELLQQSNLNESQQSYVNSALQSSELLLSIINDILDFTKIDSGKMVLYETPTALRDVVTETVQMLSEKASRKGLLICVHIDEKLAEYYQCDPVRVRQILINLLNNAVKFTDDGHINLSIHVVSTGDGCHTIRFTVEDTGVGISDENLQKVFDKFLQVDSSVTKRFEGTGLGLSICRTLVELMSGEMGVRSQIGKGSEFWFELSLPTISPSVIKDSSQESVISTNPEGLSSMKILIVDDNKMNQTLVKAHLAKLNHNVDIACDGEQAIEKFKQHKYDLIFMDCQMPVMDGYLATQKIRAIEYREHREHTPIVALTANAIIGDKEKCLKAGMDDFISKPFKRDDLLKILLNWQPKYDQAL